MKLSNLKVFKVFRASALTLVLMSTISLPQTAQADDLLRLAKSLCEAAKTDDRSGMRKKLRSAKMRLKNIYYGISCGSTGSLLRVATKAGSMGAATFIATKIGKKGLKEPGKDGKSIVEWTQGLVASGDASKQAFVDLFNSKL